MAVKTPHFALTLRGKTVDEGILVKNGQILFSPRWGMTRHSPGFAVITTAPDGSLGMVHVAVAKKGVVLITCEDTPKKELALVQEYAPGSGAKRWPSFHVGFGPEVRKLAEASTSQGSGSETWTLVSAPLGWAENIAAQFIDERDYGDQTISYNPEGKRESNLPQDLLVAFRGDEEVTRQFMAKVTKLSLDRLDDHIIRQCGRARMKSHLEEVSGDPDFFMGGDPNRVVGYIADALAGHLIPLDDDGGEEETAMARALRKAGLDS